MAHGRGFVKQLSYRDKKTGEIKLTTNFYLFYYRDGRRIREKALNLDGKPCITVATAEKALDRVNGQKQAGILPPVAASKLKYEDIRALLLRHYEKEDCASLQTLADRTKTIWGLPHLDKFFGGKKLSAITTDVLERFYDARKAEGAHPSTINRNLSLLRQMFMRTVDARKISLASVPTFKLTDESKSVRKGFVELEDFDRLLATLPDYLKPLIEFLYTAAVRLGEAQKISWNQVDLKHRIIRLHETKNGSPRTVPLRPRILRMLSDVPKEQRRGKVFYQGQFRKTWMSACIAAKIPVPGTDGISRKEKGKYVGLIVHDLRRSAIRNMSLVGGDESTIMAISGHKTNSTFKRYNIVSLQQMQNLAERQEQYEQQVRASQPALTGEVLRKALTEKGASLVQV